MYPNGTADVEVAIENLYTAAQNPVWAAMFGTNIWIIIAGKVINDDAKIIGITPAIASLSGICVFCAPTIFLPTTFLAYCTGILLSACCTNTTPAIRSIAPTIIAKAVNNPTVLNAPVPNIKSQIIVTALGNPEMIPTNIIIEIPFPIPLFVIWSPNHIKSDVPAISEITTKNPVKKSVLTNIPEDLYVKYNPIPSISASTIVKSLVYLFIAFLPSSPPSFINLSNEGITIPNNWITIEAVMYGVIVIAKIENLEKAPPEIKSIRPAIPLLALLIASFNVTVFTPGTVIKHPNLNRTIRSNVYKILFLTSGVLNALIIVLNIKSPQPFHLKLRFFLVQL